MLLNKGNYLFSKSRLPSGYIEVEYIENANDSSYVAVDGSVKDDGVTNRTVVYEQTLSLSNVSDRQVFGYGGTQCNHYFGVNSTHPEIGSSGTDINTNVILSKNIKYTFKCKFGTNNTDLTELWVYDSNGDLLPNGHNTNNQYLGKEESKFGIFTSGYGITAGGLLAKRHSRFYGGNVKFDDVLVGDLVPCYRLTDNKVGVYNLVDETFTAGTGSFVVGPAKYKPIRKFYYLNNRLPDEYQEVEYLQGDSTNKQYIKLGITTNDFIKIEGKYRYFTTTNGYIFGSQTGGARFYFVSNQSNSCFRIGEGNSYVITNDASYVNNDYSFSIDITDKANKKVDISINGGSVSTYTFGGNMPTNELYLFANSYSGGLDDYKDNRWYYFKAYDSSNQLIRNFIPCYHRSDSVAGMYDTVNNVFYTNQGTGSFIVGPDIITYKPIRKINFVNKRLPVGYQEVEYICNTGSAGQHIRSGVQDSSNIDYEIKCQRASTGENAMFGSMDTMKGHHTLYLYNNQAIADYGGKEAGFATNVDEVHIYSMTDNIFKIDGVQKWQPAKQTYIADDTIYLFMAPNGRTVASNIYYCKLWDSSVLIRHFIPCYKVSTGEIGMYDLCGSICEATNSPFYTNSGSGVFTKGPNIYL